jgi:hypothetical protein
VKIRTRVLALAGVVALSASFIAAAAPQAHATPVVVGSCGGSVGLGTLVGNGVGGGIGDQTGPVTATSHLAVSVVTKLAIPGSCTTIVSGTKVPKAIASKFTGQASCATGAAAIAADATRANIYPLNGAITVTNPDLTSSSAYISFLGVNASQPTGDVFDVGGIVTKGIGVGATVSGDIWQSPVAKLPGLYRAVNDASLISGSATIASATAKFGVKDVGGDIEGAGIDAGTTIASVTDLSHAMLSAPANHNETADHVTMNRGAYDTGYALNIPGAIGCTDSTPNNAGIKTVLIGGGGTSSTSLLGSTADGLSFSFGE